MPEIFDYSSFEENSPAIMEKKRLRRSANACGIALIVLFAVMYGWSFPAIKIASMFGVTLKQLSGFISDPFVNQLFGIFISAIMVLVPFFIAAKIMGVKVAVEAPFKTAEKDLFFPTIFMGVAFCLFSSFAAALGGQVFEGFGLEFPSPEITFPNGIFGIIISMLSTAFFPAFFEELALRGFALTILRKHGEMFAVLSSAILFGFMHANFDQIVFAFLVGLVLGYITVKTGSIWPAVAIHFINNLNSVVFSYFSKINETFSSLLLISVFALWIFLAVIGCLLIYKKDPTFFKTNEEKQVGVFEKIRWFITTPTIIIGIIISLLIAFFAR